MSEKQRASVIKRNTKHGFSVRGKRDRLYRIWANMRTRATNPNNKHYAHKKLEIDENWKLNFSSFCKWSLANGYGDNLEIDRIDNTKGYYPENCRWVSHQENCNNTQRNVNFMFNGEIKNLTQIAIITGLARGFLRCRLLRGWSIEEAISKPRKVNQWK